MIVGVGLLGSAMVLPATAQLRGEVPGSLLIFPEFNISPPAVTQLRISDVQEPALGGTTRVHLNYVCPPAGGPGASGGITGVCNEVDRHKFVTFHGTLIIDVATDLGGPFPGAPCNKGYVIAFVEDSARHPIPANQLIGSYRISGTDGDDAEAVQAIAVQSVQLPGTQLGSFDGAGELVLTFGLAPSSDYVALPSILYTDFQAVNLAAIPPKRTELIVLTPSIKSGLSNQVTQLALHWWNQFEDEHSTTKTFTCWTEFELESLPGGGLFTAAGLGTPYGSLQARVTGGAPPQAILGVIRETGPGPTLRRLYHVGLRSSTYGPDPDTAPPGP
jgi:hypothetical protein